ncbi:MAG: ABC transporter permease [Proteobacteria bacterium]|nr:ABC transporter permease [Pseudomonadota bacterium]
MNRKFFRLAYRNLIRHRTRNLLTGISIIVGTASIIVGLSFTGGIIRQTIIGFTGTLVEDVMIFPGGVKDIQMEKHSAGGKDQEDTLIFRRILFQNKSVLERYKEIEKSIYDIDGIDYITKKVQFSAAVFSEESSLNAMIVGMEPEGIRRKDNLQVNHGRYLNDDDRLSLIISEKLAARLKAEVGDKVAVVVNMPRGGTNAKDFTIVGVFAIKTGLEFASHLMYISLWDTQDLMGITDNEVFSLGVYLKDVDATDVFEAKIHKKLRGENLPGLVLTWKKLMKGFLAQYYFIRYIVLIFTIILLCIVSVGVVNSTFLSVSERTREIGTIKAMGAKSKTVVTIFIMEGLLLSSLSAFSGSTIGVLISVLFENVGIAAPTKGAATVFGGKYLYAYLTYPSVVFTFFFVIFVTMIGISIPIFKASRMEPTKALGYV